MFKGLKELFTGNKQSRQTSVAVSKPVTQAQISTEAPSAPTHSDQNDELQPLEHARELNLAFISSLLGVRAVETEQSKQQEMELRAALDAEISCMSEKTIPKLSRSAMALLHDLMSPDVPQKKIIAAVNDDPGLAGKVLSTANSSVYVAPGVKIDGLEHAVAMLGHVTLRHIVMVSLMSDKFKVNSHYFDTFGDSLWQHSTEVATNARAIATEMGGDPGLAYFVGLVHDIGKLIIFKHLIELHSTDKQQPHAQVFSNLINDYSEALTLRACETWKLPEYWYKPIIDFQHKDNQGLDSIESQALFLANTYAELNALFAAAEITQFELVWRLEGSGSNLEEFLALYPDAIKVENQ